MMAHYFKRQEELKAPAEADDDDYLHSAAWADTKAREELPRASRGACGRLVSARSFRGRGGDWRGGVFGTSGRLREAYGSDQKTCKTRP